MIVSILRLLGTLVGVGLLVNCVTTYGQMMVRIAAAGASSDIAVAHFWRLILPMAVFGLLLALPYGLLPRMVRRIAGVGVALLSLYVAFLIAGPYLGARFPGQIPSGILVMVFGNLIFGALQVLAIQKAPDRRQRRRGQSG